MVSFNPQIPISQTFQALSGQTVGLPYGDGQRVPFEFSSTLRDRFELSRQADSNAASTDVEFGTTTDVVNESFKRFAPDTLKLPIRTLINPNSISWEQSKRIERKDVRGGSVFFHFTNDAGQDNDILTLSLSGTTGNIDLRADKSPQAATQDVNARKKLEIFQQLYLLTREPRIFRPNIINEFTIRYTTKAFPEPIKFTGFYNSVLEFEESADRPNSVDWSMSFTVQRTEPSLDDIVSVTQSLLSENGVPEPALDSELFPSDSDSDG